MSMRSLKTSAVPFALVVCAGAAFAEGPNLGTPVDPASIAAWDISIQPGGAGLPLGSGTPAEGAGIYASKCAQCHGPDGKGGTVSPTPLVGGAPITDIAASMKTISN